MSAFQYPNNPKPYAVEFTLIGLPKMANQLLRGHWQVKYAHTKKWKQLTAQAIARIGFKPPSPLAHAALTLTRVSSAEPDFDGLVSGFKPIIDALVEAGLIASDKPSCIGQPVCRWQKGKPSHGCVRVRVEERN